MCFYIRNNKPKIAKKNIVCYKILDSYLSPPIHWTFKYELNKIHKEKISTTIHKETESGLYSYTKIIYARKSIWYGSRYIIYKAIIPKGSEYYTDGKQYCSNQLMIKDVYKDISWYKKLWNFIKNGLRNS